MDCKSLDESIKPNFTAIRTCLITNYYSMTMSNAD